jgi:hypothetical protein
MDVILVVVDWGVGIQEFLEYTTAIAHLVILWNGFIEERHCSRRERVVRDGKAESNVSVTVASIYITRNNMSLILDIEPEI